MKRALPLTLILFVCCSSLAWGQQSGAAGSSDWTEFHRSNMTRWNPYEKTLNPGNVANLQLLWKFATKGGVLSSPTVANGIVYIGSGDPGLNGSLCYAIDAATGGLLWSYGNPYQAILDAPAVVNGTVYYGDTSSTFYALNAATGAELWNFPADSWLTSSPVVGKSAVYILSKGGYVYALRPASGKKMWSYNTGVGSIYWPPNPSSPALSNGVIYVGAGYVMYALNAATGALLWSFPTGNDIYSSPAVANGKVYFGSADGYLYAVDAVTGALQWSSLIGYGEPTEGSPAVNKDSVFLCDIASTCYAYNAATGAQLWSYFIGGWTRSSPAVANGVVYIHGGDGGYLLALNARTGAVLGSFPTNDGTTRWGMFSSPSIVNGVIYVGSEDGNLYAFGLR